ncbi:hypothetical protein [Flavobacterium cerinum]|uniref:Curli production assembly/transport component CsgE n=1 Tax=Flavobacterium cerinum TaxID=2502784 RepID=A0ABY5ISD8_9FLAO|nr:hypothetical protein [Flavobacterium cerinum]UUC45185.1 hypothetical protein NOX80_16360 [Flavobacterium cerinum]
MNKFAFIIVTEYMTKNFSPNINRTLFKEHLLKIQDNEGNNTLVVTTLSKRLESASQLSFFDQFTEICNDYNIAFRFSQSDTSYKISILVNGSESQTFTYQDIEKDITVLLANALYEELAIQILNKVFIQNVENGIGD